MIHPLLRRVCCSLPSVLLADMDTPRSDKTHVEAELSYADKASKYAGPLSAATSVAPSIYEKGGAVVVEPEMLDVPPDGGRGWVVIFGCIIFSAATVGWGYVLRSRCPRSRMSLNIECAISSFQTLHEPSSYLRTPRPHQRPL